MSELEKRNAGKPKNVTDIRSLSTSEDDQSEPLLADCPYCHSLHEVKLIPMCPLREQALADQALYCSELVVAIMGRITNEKNTMKISDASYARLMMSAKVADVECRKLCDLLDPDPPQECGCIPNPE